MKLQAKYEDGVLTIDEDKYYDEGWEIRYVDTNPIESRWEVFEVPLCNEPRLYKSYETFREAMTGKDELT